MDQGEPGNSLLRRLVMTLGPSGRLLRAHQKAFKTWTSSQRGKTLNITIVLSAHRDIVRRLQRDLRLTEAAAGWLDIAGLPAVSRTTGIPLDPLVVAFGVQEELGELGPSLRQSPPDSAAERAARLSELLALRDELEERWVCTLW